MICRTLSRGLIALLTTFLVTSTIGCTYTVVRPNPNRHGQRPPHHAPEPSQTPPYQAPEPSQGPPYHAPEYGQRPPYHAPEHAQNPPYHDPEYGQRPPYHAPEHAQNPPYHEPAYDQSQEGTQDGELVYNERLGLYDVVDYPNHYFHRGRYYRRAHRKWHRSRYLQGPWKRVKVSALPQKLRRLHRQAKQHHKAEQLKKAHHRYDERLGLYVVVDRPHHYFHKGKYYRHTHRRWHRSHHLQGPWHPVKVAALPQKLRKLHKQQEKAKHHYDERLGLHVVEGHPNHYFHKGKYFRRTHRQWYRSHHLQGPWKRVKVAALPQKLRRLHRQAKQHHKAEQHHKTEQLAKANHRYDKRLGLYVVEGHPNHYFHKGKYFRHTHRQWHRSHHLQGPWKRVKVSNLPQKLRRLHKQAKRQLHKNHGPAKVKLHANAKHRYDERLGLHVVEGHPHHYFHKGKYFRHAHGKWHRSHHLQGPWKRVKVSNLPQKLRRLHKQAKRQLHKNHGRTKSEQREEKAQR